MDNKEKLRVLLKHWIEHNGGHVEEFDKWRQIMRDEQNDSLSNSLDQAKDQMDRVSDILQNMLDELGGPLDTDGHDHHHHHHH